MRIRVICLGIGTFHFLALTLGCAPAPVYQIKYDYLPPESAEARVCIQQCENTKIQCEEAINKELDQERVNLRRAYQQCLLSQSSTRSPVFCSDQSELIQLNYSNCWPDYNRCFRRCGGRVEEKNICVSNCR